MGAKLSGGGGSKFHVEANSEINVTPFVDVMLVLLIIFMVAAPLATVSVEVKLPPAIANPPKPVYISLQKSGNVYVGNELSSLDTLGDDLKKAIGARNPDEERIFIRCDKGTRYAEFMKVMNKLQDNGFYSVALQGEDDAK